MDQTDNNSYSVKNQTTKGLGTFVLTLSISLIIFSVIYYLMTTKSTQQDESLMLGTSGSTVTKENSGLADKGTQNGDKGFVGASEDGGSVNENKNKTDGNGSVFGDLAKISPNTSSRQVLAGSTSAPSASSTETGGSAGSTIAAGNTTPATTGLATGVSQTTSSAPETGVTSITIGLAASLSLFIFAMLFLSKGPRKIALSSFEKRSTKGL